jgi:uncharacterized membrane protein
LANSAINRILNSKAKEKKFVGEVIGKSGTKMKIRTNNGVRLVDGVTGYNKGDNVAISGTTIVGKSTNRVKPTKSEV